MTEIERSEKAHNRIQIVDALSASAYPSISGRTAVQDSEGIDVANRWNGSKWIRKEKRLAIYIRDRFTCVYCLTDLRNAEPSEVTLDHVTPRSQGGSNEATNLVTACRSCNSSRQDSDSERSIERFGAEAWTRVHIWRIEPINVRLALALIAGEAGQPEN